MKDDNKQEFTPAATKLSPQAYEDMKKLAQKKGMSFYELIQMVCDTLIRYMDDAHNLTPEMERAMAVFEHLIGWKDNFNWASPTCHPEIQEAVYFVGASDKKSMRAVHVDRPFMGQWTSTRNVQTIFERVVEVMYPERYRRLRKLAVELDCSSILDLLDLMIDSQTIAGELADLRKEFEDARRSEFGKQPAEAPFKRKHHKSVNDDNSMQLGIDFQPFGCEY